MNRKATALALNAAIVLGFAVLALLFWKLRLIDPASDAAKDVSLSNVDFFTQIYPMAQAAARSFREGAFPLWNPYQLGGFPFLATVIHGVLYPFNVAYVLLPTHIAIEARTRTTRRRLTWGSHSNPPGSRAGASEWR